MSATAVVCWVSAATQLVAGGLFAFSDALIAAVITSGIGAAGAVAAALITARAASAARANQRKLEQLERAAERQRTEHAAALEQLRQDVTAPRRLGASAGIDDVVLQPPDARPQ